MSPSTAPLTKAPKLRSYGNLKLKAKGLTNVTVEILEERKTLPVVVMENANLMLFGLHWSEIYNMTCPEPVHSVKPVQYVATFKQVLNTSLSLFDNKLGRVNDDNANIHVKT